MSAPASTASDQKTGSTACPVARRVESGQARSSPARWRRLDNQILELHDTIQYPEKREALLVVRVDDNGTPLSIDLNVIDAGVINLVGVQQLC